CRKRRSYLRTRSLRDREHARPARPGHPKKVRRPHLPHLDGRRLLEQESSTNPGRLVRPFLFGETGMAALVGRKVIIKKGSSSPKETLAAGRTKTISINKE